MFWKKNKIDDYNEFSMDVKREVVSQLATEIINANTKSIDELKKDLSENVEQFHEKIIEGAVDKLSFELTNEYTELGKQFRDMLLDKMSKDILESDKVREKIDSFYGEQIKGYLQDNRYRY